MQQEHRSVAELRDAIQAGSRDAEDFLQLANLLKSDGRHRESAEIYEAALRLPLEPAEAARLGWEFGELLEFLGGQSDRIAEIAAQSVAKLDNDATDRETRLLLGLNYSLLARARWMEGERLDRNALSRATSLLKQVVVGGIDDDSLALAEYELARCYLALADPDRAIQHARNYLRRPVSPHDRVNALTVLADAQYDAGRLDDASVTLDQLLTHPATERSVLPNVYVTLGMIRRPQGELVQARQAFEQALDLTSVYAIDSAKRSFQIIALWQLAELHSEGGAPDKAVPLYRRLLESYDQNDPHRPPLLNCLGTCHATLGHISEARHYFGEVMASSASGPEDIEYARNQLSRLMA